MAEHSRRNSPQLSRIGQVCVLVLLIATCIITAAAAASITSDTSDTTTLPGYTQVTVTNVTVDPGVFYTGDTGTITVEVANTGTQSVGVHRVTLYDNGNDITLVSSGTYDTVGSIGAGNKQKFVFTVLADAPEGIYYPVFSMEFQGTGYLRYPIHIQVKDSPVILSIKEKPDSFASDKKSTITLTLSNTRTNTIKNIIVSPRGTDADVIPTTAVISSLEPGMSATLPFSVTPQTSSTLEFDASYLNGINIHHTNITIPLVFNADKTRADPVINNIEVTSQGGSYEVTGDITNSGLENANSVTVTVDAPGVPVDPYKEYAVGLLKPDDFSGFQLTFALNGAAQEVPLIVHWKDGDGNVYSETAQINLRSSGTTANAGTAANSRPQGGGGMGLFGSRQSGMFSFPWLWLIGGVIVAAAGFLVWRRYRKGRKA